MFLGVDRYGGSCCVLVMLLRAGCAWLGMWNVGSARAREHPEEKWKLSVLGAILWMAVGLTIGLEAFVVLRALR